MAQLNLRDVPVGGMACVRGFADTHRSYRSKLLSLGLTRGTPLFVQRVAPLGDPIHITVRGYELSLRRDEADALILETLDGDPEDYGFNGHHGRGRGLGRGLGRGRGFGRGRGQGGRGGHRRGLGRRKGGAA